ncbi:MAG: TetR family transcriptional regulator C-terminal domain-containing protein [Mobilicoccus sp.]|nr:TetR family transcriptional regulator C-terminal domain-containing protein [Mobilicoccus sp.]
MTTTDRRVRIIEAVWLLIATEGIDAVSVRRVAALAEVSIGAVQHHFATRDDLVRGSAEAMVTSAEGQYVEEVGDATPATERLRFAVAHVIPRSRQARVGTTVWLAYVAKSVSDPAIAAVLAGAKRGQEDEVTTLLDGDRAGARHLIALADGLATRVLLGDLTVEEADTALEAALT